LIVILCIIQMGKPGYEGLLRQVPSSAGQQQGQPLYFRLSVIQETVIGRDPVTCQIVLDSTQYAAVSRRHALIRPLFQIESLPQSKPSSQSEPLLKSEPLPQAESAENPPLWEICDLKSANGTFVNGRQIQGCCKLIVGDRVLLSEDGPEFILECRAIQPGSVPEPTGPVASRLSRRPERESDLTLSQLLPIVSRSADLAQKAYLIPGVVAVTFVILLFMVASDPRLFRTLLAIYLGGVGYYFIYQLCGKHKPIWVLLLCALTTVGLIRSPALNGFIWLFRDVLPGRLSEDSPQFFSQLIGHFFGSGLMEELLKAVPVLGLYLLGRQLRSPWRERIGIWEPLDGILLAAASALGFTWQETLAQTVPGLEQEVAMKLVIPRMLGSIAGHMAYSGYFGYFIGLSVLKPSRRGRILAIGWLTSATIHALWNTSSGTFGPMGLAVVGVFSYAFLTAAILKARELSPTRSQNFATRSK
jgi:RsiW-degrading membrane proteinase PrsW (M82 family)